MRILFAGDVVGRSGRDAIEKYLPELKSQHKVDLTIVNVDNAAHGFGVTTKICEDFIALGADCLTGGNHVWDQKEIIPYIDREKRLLRTINYPQGVPGQGALLLDVQGGRKALVVHVMGRLFMDTLDDPFKALDDILQRYPLGQAVQAVFVDIHAEATSEKMALAQYLDGRVTAVVGTHTHIPTADCQVLPKGTAFQADAGMTGDYNSVIGFRPDIPIQRFVRKFAVEKLTPAEGEATFCGTLIETDDTTGKAKSIRPIRVGGRLMQTE